MPKKAKKTPLPRPPPPSLDGFERWAVYFGSWFLAVCFFLGGFFYMDDTLTAAAADWTIGVLFAPPMASVIARRWPDAARARAREVFIVLLITFSAFYLG